MLEPAISVEDTELTDYKIVVKPHRGWLRVDWRELWEYRDLLTLLVKRDFSVKYKQTILGPAWFVLQPLMFTVVFTIIFGRVARIPTDGLPPFLFYLCGQLGWSYFANTVSASSNTFTANAPLFGKVYFPRLVVPFSIAVSNLFAFVIQAATFAIFWVYFRWFTAAGTELSLSPSLLFLPVLVVVSGCLALGVGLWFSAATSKYKDLMHALGLLVQLWLYATPVIYPLSTIPAHWRWVAELNPMATIVELYKLILLGQGTFSGFGLTWTILSTTAVLFTGLMIFHKVERTFIDTV